MSPAQADEIGFQEGSRWINKRPSGTEVADWFKGNVELHEGLKPEKYVTGVTLIGANEKIKEVRRNANDQDVQVEIQRYTWTPYAKVETRVAYFWDLMALHPEWLGQIAPVEVPRTTDQGVYNANLPAGFFRLPIPLNDGQFAIFLCCSMRCRVLDRSTVEKVHTVRQITDADGSVIEERQRHGYDGVPVFEFPPAVKMIAQLGRYGADEFSLMKAETGAVGRALGMAGMLVIPGSGIATAEDMQEVPQHAANPEEATLPPAEEPKAPVDVEEVVQAGIARLQSEAPLLYDELAAWAAEKKIDLMTIKDTQLRGVLAQVERKLAKMIEATA